MEFEMNLEQTFNNRRQILWQEYQCLHRCTAVHRSITADQREDGRDSRHYRRQEGILYFHGVSTRQ